MLPKISPLLSALIALLVGQSAQLNLTFTANTTTVQVFQAFAVRCQLVDYTPQDERFDVGFDRSSLVIGYYRSQVEPTPQQRQTDFYVVNGNRSDLEVAPLNATFPVYEVAITPKTLTAHSYCCRFWNSSSNSDVYSKQIAVTVTPPPPVVSFVANVVKVEPAKPFTATCTIYSFEIHNRNYSIRFERTSGLLATYIFTPTAPSHSPHVVFVVTKQREITVSRGKVFAYPTFEIDLRATHPPSQTDDYWCVLVDQGTEHPSNVWSSSIVRLSSNVTEHKNGIVFTVRCKINNLRLTGTMYSVAFIATHYGRLATQTIRPNEPDDLVIETLPPGITVTQGTSLDFPVYEIAVNMTGPSRQFWCILKVGEKSAAEYKSNQVNI